MKGHESEYIISILFHMSYCFTLYDDSDRLMVSNSNEKNRNSATTVF